MTDNPTDDPIRLHLSLQQAQVVLDALYEVEPQTELSMDLIENLEGALKCFSDGK